MQLRGYFLTLALGILGFTITIFSLNYISVGRLNVDAQIYIVDNKDSLLVHDTLMVKSPIQTLSKKSQPAKVTESNKPRVSIKQISFSYHPMYIVWILIISIGIGFALALIPYLISQLAKLYREVSWRTFISATSSAVLTALLVLFMSQISAEGNVYRITDLLEHLNILFNNPKTILLIITSIFLVPNLLSTGGAFIIIAKVLRGRANMTMIELQQLNNKYSLFMIISSIMLVFGVLSGTFLRASVLEYLPATYHFLYPNQFVITYSLIFTFFMIIFYLPGELLLRNRMTEMKAGLSEEEIQHFEQTNSSYSLYKTGISILAPLLSTMVLEGLNNITL